MLLDIVMLLLNNLAHIQKIIQENRGKCKRFIETMMTIVQGLVHGKIQRHGGKTEGKQRIYKK